MLKDMKIQKVLNSVSKNPHTQIQNRYTSGSIFISPKNKFKFVSEKSVCYMTIHVGRQLYIICNKELHVYMTSIYRFLLCKFLRLLVDSGRNFRHFFVCE